MGDIRGEEAVRQAFVNADPDGPFVMVNFLKFKSGGGSKDYGRYGTAFAALIKKYGGEFIYNGRVAQRFVGDDEWHAVALVRYPSRKAFHELTTSDEYRKIHPFREEGLEKTLVYATIPVDRDRVGLT